jgi:DNA-binding NtrC family response regulator
MSVVDGDEPAAARPRVLLIDDDDAIARSVGRLFRLHDVHVDHVSAVAQVEELLARPDGIEAWDVILLDVNLPHISGLDILRRLRDSGASVAVVMLTGDNSASTATEALRAGAFHYIVKPMLNHSLIDVVMLAARQTEVVRHTRPARASTESDVLVGDSLVMRGLRSSLEQVAPSSASVLIVGESGTGKELVARTLHRLSDRASGPFVPLNCGALPEGLIDSELFGHTRGAFTGATSARPGVFVEADGGTLFLDEIGDMPLAVQVRLLRALQEREVRAVGSDAVRTVDVRVIAATHVDLSRAVADGRFRTDLFFRLNVVSIQVPPLRERREDIPALVARLLQRHGGTTTPSLSPDALEAILAYHWPGNVRELENAIQHAVALTRGERIEVRALPTSVVASSRFSSPAAPFAASQTGPLPSAVGTVAGSDPAVSVTSLDDGVSLTDAKRKAALDFEKAYLERVLEHAKGSISAASRMAGIDRTNFRRLLQRHGIDSTRYRS